VRGARQGALLRRGFAADTPVYLASSVAATVGAIALSFPVDVAKTVLINQGVGGVARCPHAAHAGCAGAGVGAAAPTQSPYRGMAHCIASTARARGVLGLYHGVLPSLARQLVCNTVLFVVYEELKARFWDTADSTLAA
jgi:hypothetical protein